MCFFKITVNTYTSNDVVFALDLFAFLVNFTVFASCHFKERRTS